ncbi:MAG: hypothetical protein WBG12_17560 [Xanthobacteraceae bacterium]
MKLQNVQLARRVCRTQTARHPIIIILYDRKVKWYAAAITARMAVISGLPLQKTSAGNAAERAEMK